MFTAIQKACQPTIKEGLLPSTSAINSIDTPIGFTYPESLPNISIKEVGDTGTFQVSGFNITDGMPTGTTYYVKTTGSDVADGLTWGTALASINVALGKGDVDVIYVETGLYTRTAGFNGVACARDVSVIAYGGAVVSATYDHLSWAPDGGEPTVSTAARSAVWGVYDGTNLDSDGDAEPLTLQANVAAVAANPGSWYKDATHVWVLPFDSRAADNDIWAFITVKNARALDKDFYIEGFELRGGTPSGDFRNVTGAYTQVRAKDCEFKYTRDGDSGGFRTQGKVSSVCQNVVAGKNIPDGFNYHSTDGTHIPVALEIDCVGRNNGENSDNIDNGSSMHEAGTVVRINGDYYGNFGPNIIDVNTSFSWNLGVHAYSSQAAAEDTDFYIDGNMWLDKCSVVNSTSTTNYNAAVGVIYYTRMGSLTGSGSLTEYTRTYL